MQAYLDGKEIEFYSSDFNEWHTAAMTNIIGIIDNIDSYRIKPELKYRPFKDAEECWTEMQNHQPFGWVKSKVFEYVGAIRSVSFELDTLCICDSHVTFKEGFNKYTFADGVPFGVKVEE